MKKKLEINTSINVPHFLQNEKTRLQTPITIAMQKNGELSGIARDFLAAFLKINIHSKPTGRELTAQDGTSTTIFSRNSDIIKLVNHGAADIGVIGTDQLIEQGFGHLLGIESHKAPSTNITILKTLETSKPWRIVLATKSNIQRLEQIGQIATSYPVIAQAFFTSIDIPNIQIVTVGGSTEAMIDLEFNGSPVDGIVDFVVSGNTLKANGLTAWDGDILKIYPVVIANTNSLRNLQPNLS